MATWVDAYRRIARTNHAAVKTAADFVSKMTGFPVSPSRVAARSALATHSDYLAAAKREALYVISRALSPDCPLRGPDLPMIGQ